MTIDSAGFWKKSKTKNQKNTQENENFENVKKDF